MTADSAHKSQWAIGEVVFGIPLLIAIVLQWMAPLSLPQGILRQMLIPFGMILIASGIGWVVLARREFARYAQPTDPGRPTSKIVKTGVFALSRNPLYLGSVLVILGFGLALNAHWLVVMLVPSVIACHIILILPEERYLAAKFPAEYREYQAAVYRWLGHK